MWTYVRISVRGDSPEDLYQQDLIAKKNCMFLTSERNMQDDNSIWSLNRRTLDTSNPQDQQPEGIRFGFICFIWFLNREVDLTSEIRELDVRGEGCHQLMCWIDLVFYEYWLYSKGYMWKAMHNFDFYSKWCVRFLA